MSRFSLTACAVVFVVLAFTTFLPAVTAQVLTPKAEDVRFQVVTSEPIAAPDNRSVVAGWSATVIRDRQTGKCFVAVAEGKSVSLASTECR